MSSADREQLAIVRESTWGVNPGGTLQVLRMTGESIVPQIEYSQSDELRADRQNSDVFRMSVAAGGDTNHEFSSRAYDEYIAAALGKSAWAAGWTETGTTFSVVAGTGSYVINDSANGFTAAVGQWCLVAGFANAANNGIRKISAASAGSITLVGGGNGANESAGATVTIKGGQEVTDGTDEVSFSMEKWNTDTGIRQLFVGLELDGFQLQTAAKSKVVLNFTWMGRRASIDDVDPGYTYTPAPTRRVMQTVDHVPTVLEDLTAIKVTEINLDVKGNLRSRTNVGDDGAESLAQGTFEITGTAKRYFRTKGMMESFINATERSLAWVYRDIGGDYYVVDVPCVQYTQGRAAAGGRNQDIIADLTWTAKMHPTEGHTIRVTRIRSS